jgi:WD40 repeat protein
MRGDNGSVRLWSSEGKAIKTIVAQQGNISSASWSAEEQILATSGDDGSVKLWSWTGNIIKTIDTQQRRVRSISWSGDGQILTTGGNDGSIKFWSPTGEAIRTIAQPGWVTSISWSGDGQILATGGDDGRARLWDREGEAIKTIDTQQDRVTSVSWSRDGQILATGGLDGSVKLWKRTGEAIKTIDTQQDSVWSVSRNRDGQTIAVGGYDGSVKLVPLEDLDMLLTRGCHWLNSYLIIKPQALQKLKVCQTPERLRATAPKFVKDSEALARDGNVEGAIEGFRTAQQWNPSLVDFNPVARANELDQAAKQAKAKQEAFKKLQSEINELLSANQADRALTKLREAIVLNPDLPISNDNWYAICWIGSLDGKAALVLPACEEAVTRAPDRGIRDSRGLARALTGVRKERSKIFNSPSNGRMTKK